MNVEPLALFSPVSQTSTRAALDHLRIAQEVMSGHGEKIAAHLIQLAIDEVEMIVQERRG